MKTAIQTFSLALFLFLSFNLSAQERQNRDLRKFDAISVGGGIDLNLTQSESQSVVIAANEDIIDRILTEVQGSTLKIYIKDSYKYNYGKNGPMVADVSLPYLKKLMASGGSDVQSMGEWKSDDFRIQASGGSDITLKLIAESLEVQCSGGSDLDINGKVDDLEIQSSGGSDFNGKQLIAKEARIQSSGGSDVYIHVTDKLVVRASGSSDVYYKGDPAIRDIDSSSSADVRKY